MSLGLPTYSPDPHVGVGIDRVAATFRDPRLPARFWAKVRIGAIPAHRPDLGACWEWTGAKRHGYGACHVGSRTDGTRKMVQVHRWAYEQLIGPIPSGLEPDHLCRNHACMNATHLELVTHSENLRRGEHWQRRKTHCPLGHPYAGANLYMKPRGGRECWACRTSRQQKRIAHTAAHGAKLVPEEAWRWFPKLPKEAYRP